MQNIERYFDLALDTIIACRSTIGRSTRVCSRTKKGAPNELLTRPVDDGGKHVLLFFLLCVATNYSLKEYNECSNKLIFSLVLILCVFFLDFFFFFASVCCVCCCSWTLTRFAQQKHSSSKRNSCNSIKFVLTVTARQRPQWKNSARRKIMHRMQIKRSKWVWIIWVDVRNASAHHKKTAMMERWAIVPNSASRPLVQCTSVRCIRLRKYEPPFCSRFIFLLLLSIPFQFTQSIQAMDEEKNKLDAFCEQSLKNVSNISRDSSFCFFHFEWIDGIIRVNGHSTWMDGVREWLLCGTVNEWIPMDKFLSAAYEPAPLEWRNGWESQRQHKSRLGWEYEQLA